MDANRVFLGTYGKIFIGGVWQSNFNHLEANVEIQKRELNLAGDPWVRHKKGPMKGTGTVSGFKVTSDMITRGFDKFELISKLEDPEAFGFESITLKNVMLDKLQLANWTAGEEVKEEVSFTFEEYTLNDRVVAV
ncbi:phage tail tube protein [Paenibacillus hodogayensis]|uniref:Phage tail tube protein n=1 Tax=Paenibacillus hodogayensis TaxID=279208 RepID=A0ABV5W0X4_9BACL